MAQKVHFVTYIKKYRNNIYLMKNYFISSCHQLSFNIIMELHIQPIKWSKISYICNMSLNSDQTMFNMNKTFVGLYIGCRLKNYDMRFQIKTNNVTYIMHF